MLTINDTQLEYIAGLIKDCTSCIYYWKKADTKTVKNILKYYGYEDIEVGFIKAMWPGNKCLRITIWTGDPECLYRCIDFEY